MAGKKTKTKKEPKFIAVNDISWINQFVDKNEKTWHYNVGASLRSISNMSHLPISQVKPKNGSSNFGLSTGFSIKAIDILQEKMSNHPDNFDNGKMLKW